MNNLELVVGLEMHCELKSNAKVFSKARNSFSDTANCNVSPVDMAFPGVLPILNKKCISHAVKMAHILNCTIADKMIFDRKNYYYPDLPKGYQITQFTKPVGVNGYIDVKVNKKNKRILIHDIHLEEDSASLDHYNNMTTIDYNRAGIPLLEIVTEPVFNSTDEVLAFLEYVIASYRYTNISDADTKKGQIRCDVNVNLRSNGKFVTPRVEVKNVNGVKNIIDTIKFEEKRQTEAYLNKENLIQETRRFDEEKGITIGMRTKVDAIDYKYFIEPNIPPFKLDKKWVEEQIKEIPVLPMIRKDIYMNELGLSEYDSNILIQNKDIADYFEKCVKLGIDSKMAANWVSVNIISELNKNSQNINDFFIIPEYLKIITDNIKSGIISSKQAKEIFSEALNKKINPKELIKTQDKQISDKGTLESIIKNIIMNNPKQKSEYLNGRTNIFDYFVGQVMKETKGKANPVLTKELLKRELDKR